MGAPPQSRSRRTDRRALGLNRIRYVELSTLGRGVCGTWPWRAETDSANAFVAPSHQFGRLGISHYDAAEFYPARLWRPVCVEGAPNRPARPIVASGSRNAEKSNFEPRRRAFHSARPGFHAADARLQSVATLVFELARVCLRRRPHVGNGSWPCRNG